MRTLIPFFSLLLSVLSSFAQPNKLVNAQNFLQSGELDKAKSEIDLAALHERTEANEKTWRYRGDIYFALYTSQNEQYKSLEKEPLKIASKSYQQALEIDPDGRYQKEIHEKLMIIGNYGLNEGVADYNKGDYKRALANFVISINAAQAVGKIDTLAIYNAGLAAEKSGDQINAIYYYKRCVDLGYQGPACCLFIIDQYRQEGNESAAINQINDCQERFPKDPQMKIAALNYYLKSGNNEKAKVLLNESIQNDLENAVLHLTLGALLQNEGDLNGAIASYNKSLAIDPNYFDPIYNLGALY